MTVAIKFASAIFNDSNHFQRLADAIRRCGAFSGIHDFDLETKIDAGFEGDLSEWTTDTTDGTSWTIT